MTLYYTDAADFVVRIPNYLKIQLLDDAHTGTPSVTLIEDLLEESEGYVDSFLSVRYVTPLTDAVLRTAKRISLDVFCLRAHRRLGPPTEEMRLEQERIERELIAIRDGSMERQPEHVEQVRTEYHATVTTAMASTDLAGW